MTEKNHPIPLHKLLTETGHKQVDTFRRAAGKDFISFVLPGMDELRTVSRDARATP